MDFPEDGGVTGYFSPNMTKQDLELVKEFLTDQKIDILTTRDFKRDDKFIITVGSISTENSKDEVVFKGSKFKIEYGEFAPFLEECNKYLKQALKYCANETQERMV